MKKALASAAAVSILAAGAFATPAVAETTAAPTKPAPTAPTAPTSEERLDNAKVVGAELDNAKKGVDTAKGIIDGLNGLKDFFGFNDSGK